VGLAHPVCSAHCLYLVLIQHACASAGFGAGYGAGNGAGDDDDGAGYGAGAGVQSSSTECRYQRQRAMDSSTTSYSREPPSSYALAGSQPSSALISRIIFLKLREDYRVEGLHPIIHPFILSTPPSPAIQSPRAPPRSRISATYPGSYHLTPPSPRLINLCLCLCLQPQFASNSMIWQMCLPI
jgi:hypothetical protein